MKKTKESLEKTELLQKLVEYIQFVDVNEDLEIISDDNLYSLEQDVQDNVEQLNIEYATDIDKQIDNIGQHILSKIFGLNEEKFDAVMKRIDMWRV